MDNVLINTFKKIKSILEKQSPPFLTRGKEEEGKFELYVEGEIKTANRNLSELSFISVIIQKKHVGFYFMPIYIEPELQSKLDQVFLKKLKGKSCFHIKSFDEETRLHVEKAVEIGKAFYKENGWL